MLHLLLLYLVPVLSALPDDESRGGAGLREHAIALGLPSSHHWLVPTPLWWVFWFAV